MMNREQNPKPPNYHKDVTFHIQFTVNWTDPRLRQVVRLRMVSDPGHPAWDITYCHGQLKTGEFVEVQVPFSQLPKRGYRKKIVEHAKKAGVHAARLGILDNISTFT